MYILIVIQVLSFEVLSVISGINKMTIEGIWRTILMCYNMLSSSLPTCEKCLVQVLADGRCSRNTVVSHNHGQAI